MRVQRKFVVGGAVIALVLAVLVWSGVRQSVVYFVTPSELLAAPGETAGKAYRLGGVVVKGSLQKDPAIREHRFLLSDGKASIPVRFQGVPPDLFAEERGAVVEGTLGIDGTFQASTIMAKHSEEYRAPEGAESGYQQLLRTFQGAEPSSDARQPGS